MNAELHLMKSQWYFVAATCKAATGDAALYQESSGTRYNNPISKVAGIDFRSYVRETLWFKPRNLPELPFLLAAARDWQCLCETFKTQRYNDKLDRPAVFGRALSREELDAFRASGKPRINGCLAA